MSVHSKLCTSKDGTKIYAEAVGDPSKPHVVFIHGLACSTLAFSKQFTDGRLIEHIYMVAYDMRGHGRSGMPDNPQAYESARMAEDFAAVVDVFHLNRPFLAGWSLGATISADVCTAYGPSVLSGLIFLGGHPYFGPEILARIGNSAIPHLSRGFLATDDVALYSQVLLDFVDSVVADPTSLAFETKVAWLGCVALQPPNVRRYHLAKSQDPTRLIEEGGKILPLLILQGVMDTHVKGEVMIQEMRTVFMDIEAKVIANAGHAVFWDQPDIVREEILRFVARVTN